MQPHDAPALLAAARQQLQYTPQPPGGDITGGVWATGQQIVNSRVDLLFFGADDLWTKIHFSFFLVVFCVGQSSLKRYIFVFRFIMGLMFFCHSTKRINSVGLDTLERNNTKKTIEEIFVFILFSIRTKNCYTFIVEKMTFTPANQSPINYAQL